MERIFNIPVLKECTLDNDRIKELLETNTLYGEGVRPDFIKSDLITFFTIRIDKAVFRITNINTTTGDVTIQSIKNNKISEDLVKNMTKDNLCPRALTSQKTGNLILITIDYKE